MRASPESAGPREAGPREEGPEWPGPMPGMGLRRGLFFGAVLGTTGAGAWLMVQIMANGGISALEAFILALFTFTFAWISIAFWNGVVGVLLHLLDRDPLTLTRWGGRQTERATARTALVMPIHNEDADRVMAGMAATLDSLEATGEAAGFDAFLLSDTTDPEIARAEEIAMRRLRARHRGSSELHYRRRARNVGRKAGNVAEFCRRWGSSYEYMVVLDADSLMAGPTLVELVRRMEANPSAGLIQTVPIPARQRTLFGRLIQFAAGLYSPILAAGQSFWQGDAANYWGHNAIIRVEPFTRHAQLPLLPGTPPLGGEILSHDFVEAALLRREGWGVYLAADLGGSWEEVPSNLVDFAVRERRWCQGSLQHLRLVAGPGFHPLSRLHMFLGAANYLASVLWLLLLLAGSVYVLIPAATGRALWFPPPDVGPELLSLLVITGLLLFLPKILGVGLILARSRKEFGGGIRLAVSAFLEGLFSVILAPAMMLLHSWFVLQILAGRNVRWAAQPREGRDLSWSETRRRTLWIGLMGAAWTGITLVVSPLFALWMTPIFGGLLAAPLLAWWTGREGPGNRTRRWGLFRLPWELRPPSELRLSASRNPVAAPEGRRAEAWIPTSSSQPRAVPVPRAGPAPSEADSSTAGSALEKG
jgi:membrane glycosyltransferase